MSLNSLFFKIPAVKIIILILTISLLSASLTACWDLYELSSLAIVVGAGIDLSDNNHLRLTLQITKPPNSTGSEPSQALQSRAYSIVIWADGNTLEEAEKKLSLQMSRKLYWGDNNTMVIGEKMAVHGLNLITNYLHRPASPRETMSLMVCKGEARDFILTQARLDNTSSQAIGLLLKRNAPYNVNLQEYTTVRSTKGMHPSIPLVELTEQNASPEAIGTQASVIQKTGTFSGTAVFKEDKMVGWLNLYETMGLTWLKNKKFITPIIIDDPEEPNKKISAEFIKYKVKISPVYDGKNIIFQIKVKAEGKIIEQQSSKEIANLQRIEILKNEFAKQIKQMLNLTILKAQKQYHSDIFGFGESFHRKYKKEWRILQNNWDEHFVNAEINISVSSEISHIGLVTNRFGM